MEAIFNEFDTYNMQLQPTSLCEQLGWANPSLYEQLTVNIRIRNVQFLNIKYINKYYYIIK